MLIYNSRILYKKMGGTFAPSFFISTRLFPIRNWGARTPPGRLPDALGHFPDASGTLRTALGCHRVLIGHSERREYFNETDASVAQQLKLALDHGLRPILCIGEKLEDREAGRTNELVGGQLEAAIAQLSLEELAKVDVAYEPVWAIGTGKVASPQQAQEVHAILRERLRYRDRTLAESMRIVYGGSVKPDNAAELMNKDDVDGALVGGASLKAESFKAIIESI